MRHRGNHPTLLARRGHRARALADLKPGHELKFSLQIRVKPRAHFQQAAVGGAARHDRLVSTPLDERSKHVGDGENANQDRNFARLSNGAGLHCREAQMPIAIAQGQGLRMAARKTGVAVTTARGARSWSDCGSQELIQPPFVWTNSDLFLLSTCPAPAQK